MTSKPAAEDRLQTQSETRLGGDLTNRDVPPPASQKTSTAHFLHWTLTSRRFHSYRNDVSVFKVRKQRCWAHWKSHWMNHPLNKRRLMRNRTTRSQSCLYRTATFQIWSIHLKTFRENRSYRCLQHHSLMPFKTGNSNRKGHISQLQTQTMFPPQTPASPEH